MSIDCSKVSSNFSKYICSLPGPLCSPGSYASILDLGYDENYLANTSDYKFAAIEKFQPDEAKASIVIDADDDYSIKDFEIIWLDFDSNGFAGEVYSYTGLEKEIVGIKYKDKIYDLEPVRTSSYLWPFNSSKFF